MQKLIVTVRLTDNGHITGLCTEARDRMHAHELIQAWIDTCGLDPYSVESWRATLDGHRFTYGDWSDFPR